MRVRRSPLAKQFVVLVLREPQRDPNGPPHGTQTGRQMRQERTHDICLPPAKGYVPLKQSQGWGPTSTPLGLGITGGFAIPPQVITEAWSTPPQAPPQSTPP